MYCPHCNEPISSQHTICPECGSDLSSFIPEAGSSRLEAMKPVKLTTVVQNYDAGIILNLLENNHIPCFKKDQFTGGYMNLYMGYSVYGQDIFVDEADYEKALALIQILDPIKATDREDASLSYPVFYKNPHIVARIILGFMAAGMIAAVIIGFLTSK